MTTFWLVIKAIFVVLPAIIQLVREGRIKEATLEEVEHELLKQHEARIDRVRDAAKRFDPNGVHDDSYDRAGRED